MKYSSAAYLLHESNRFITFNNCDENSLQLDFNGEIRIFEK